MPNRIIRFWLRLLLLVLAAIAVAYLLRHDPLYRVFPAILGWAVFVALIANVLLSLAPPWRRYFWPVSKFCVTVLVPIAAFILTNAYFYPLDLKNAKNYVAIIQPRLEEFRRTTGHYPHALTEIGDLPSPPTGLIYSKDTETDEDNYRIAYFGSIYFSSSHDWFDDD